MFQKLFSIGKERFNFIELFIHEGEEDADIKRILKAFKNEIM